MYDFEVVLGAFNGPVDEPLSFATLQALLDAMTSFDLLVLRFDPAFPYLYDAGVRYFKNRLRRDRWKDARTTLADRMGDCKDLSCWRAAELQKIGIPARAVFKHSYGMENGRPTNDFHAYVEVAPCDRYPYGAVEDPSVVCGLNPLELGSLRVA